MPKLTADHLVQAKTQDNHLAVLAKNKQITSLDGISELVPVNLDSLDLSLNMIQDLGSNLSRFIYLRSLDLSTNLLTNLSGIYRLSLLESLKLSRNRISKIEGLESLTRLKLLDLSLNKITTIEGLESLYSLNTLYLYGNQISILQGLETLRDLKVLRIEQNLLEDITHCAVHNRSLEVLEAHSNKVDDMNSIVIALSRMKALKVLSLHNNPVEKEESYKVRIISCRNIEKLDGLEIKDYMREALLDLTQEYNVENAVDLTTGKYQALINTEQELKDAEVNRLRSQIQELESGYSKYYVSMQKEMDSLNAYAGMVHHKRLQGEDISQDQHKLQDWTERVIQKEQERKAEVQVKLKSLKPPETPQKIADGPALLTTQSSSSLRAATHNNQPDYRSQLLSPTSPANPSSQFRPQLLSPTQLRSQVLSADSHSLKSDSKSSFPIIGDIYHQEILDAVELQERRNSKLNIRTEVTQQSQTLEIPQSVHAPDHSSQSVQSAAPNTATTVDKKGSSCCNIF